jgi:hypothetical protein
MASDRRGRGPKRVHRSILRVRPNAYSWAGIVKNSESGRLLKKGDQPPLVHRAQRTVARRAAASPDEEFNALWNAYHGIIRAES